MFCNMNSLFIAFTGKDTGLAGTPDPGRVKRHYYLSNIYLIYSIWEESFTAKTYSIILSK